MNFESIVGLPLWFGYLAVVMLGALIGSFLNVVIHRIPREQSIVFPNSGCPKCGNAIKPYDNIPVVSWLVLRGKCRGCQEPISPRYPAVEALTAVVFGIVFYETGFTPMLPVNLIFAATMISLVFIDAEHMILPDKITFPLLGLAILVRLVFPLVLAGGWVFPDLTHMPLVSMDSSPQWLVSLLGAILGALMGGGSLWLIGFLWEKLRGVEAMGFGDVKMMFGVGALLGWRLTFLTIFLGAFTGAVAGVLVISRSKDKDMQAQIPFGIFLGSGALISLLFGEQMIGWYLRTFVP
ncbi:MAG: prepilin peptidase [Pyrinomonadaceae bacterium]